jgi:FkbM family methyltransferase
MSLIPARIASKPQYVFHPLRALRRFMYRAGDPGERRVTGLPWGLPLEVHTTDAVGFSIVAGRVFDPCVTETLHRLIDPGELVLDVGANVGYLTSLAAVRVGPEGRVLGFEPHPGVFALLEKNAARWRQANGIGTVELHRMALSDHAGEGALFAHQAFEANMGLATLADDEAPDGDGTTITVTLGRLDDLVGDARVGVMKIDVEGHEAEVLKGAGELLASGRVRDIVFEDQNEYPSEATAILEQAGYELISLDNDLFGLTLRPPQDRGEIRAWPGPSYLATLDAARARERLRPRGWRVRGIGPGLSR